MRPLATRLPPLCRDHRRDVDPPLRHSGREEHPRSWPLSAVARMTTLSRSSSTARSTPSRPLPDAAVEATATAATATKRTIDEATRAAQIAARRAALPPRASRGRHRTALSVALGGLLGFLA